MYLPSRAKAFDRVFHRDQNLKKRIFDAITETPHYAPLFEDIAQFCETYQNPTVSAGLPNGTPEPAAKKRKLDDGTDPVSEHANEKCLLEVKDVSFSIPQRKKLHLEIIQYAGRSVIRARNSVTSAIEFGHSASDIDYTIRLPIPEKAQKQFNYCLLPKEVDMEPIVFTVNAGPLKNFDLDTEFSGLAQEPEDVLENMLKRIMEQSNSEFIRPEEAEFASATPESHRKSEKAYHVKAFKGSKEGYLFFLRAGIFFGFKKPLLFFGFDMIESTSYTSVLQRTFNLNVAYKQTSEAVPREVEFSMIDQADFVGIDAYIKRHQLQDASMAEVRRAKKLNVNGANKGVETGEVNPDDDRTELQKAEQELEDEEDEQEEDFEPSDEDSDGSGSSGDEEEEEYAEDEQEGNDLVAEELGSEAEDVETDEEDDDLL